MSSSALATSAAASASTASAYGSSRADTPSVVATVGATIYNDEEEIIRKILVIGATGGTGRMVVDTALNRGFHVTALVRDPAQAPALSGAEVVTGDIRDASALDAALCGVDAVVSCLGVRRGPDPGTVRSVGTARLVEQMARHGVQRLVAVSSVGVGSSADDQSRTARALWRRLAGRDRLAEADRAAQAVRAAGANLAWTVVRPSRLTDGAGGGALRVGPDVPTRMRSELTRADLARVLVDQLTDDRFVGVAVTAAAAR